MTRHRMVALVATLHLSFLTYGFVRFLMDGYAPLGGDRYLSNIGQIHVLNDHPGFWAMSAHYGVSLIGLSALYATALLVPGLLQSQGPARRARRRVHVALGALASLAFLSMLLPGAIETLRIFEGHFKYYLLVFGAVITFIVAMCALTATPAKRELHRFWSRWFVNIGLLQALTTALIWTLQQTFPEHSEVALYVAVYAVSLGSTGVLALDWRRLRRLRSVTSRAA